MNARIKLFWGAILIVALVVAGDQLSKAWMLVHLFDHAVTFPDLRQPQQIVLTSFFNLTPVWNQGVSFGLLKGDSAAHRATLIGLGSVLCLVVAYWLMIQKSALSRAAMALILGGAIGNLIDRVRFGAVVDFLDLHWGDWHWPAFNLADVSIVVGVGILLLHGFTNVPFRAKNEG